MFLNKADLTDLQKEELRFVRITKVVDFESKKETGEFKVHVLDSENNEHTIKTRFFDRQLTMGDVVELINPTGTFYVYNKRLALSLKADEVRKRQSTVKVEFDFNAKKNKAV